MASPAQILANRSNSTRSTGPQTKAGKAASSANRTTHGLTARRTVLNQENQQEFDHLLANLSHDFSPKTTVEHQLVRELAESYWRLTRARQIEAMTFDKAMESSDLATAFIEQSQNLEKIRRYMTTIERSYYKALAQLQKIAATRTKSVPVSDPIRDYIFAPIRTSKERIGFDSQNEEEDGSDWPELDDESDDAAISPGQGA
jgi:hypothetical protein